MLKLCENGSNIDYLYETSSVLRKATETEISGDLLASIQFGFLKAEPKFGFRTSLVILLLFDVCQHLLHVLCAGRQCWWLWH